MQSTPPIHTRPALLALRYRHARRPRQHHQVGATLPRHVLSLQSAQQESAQRRRVSHQRAAAHPSPRRSDSLDGARLRGLRASAAAPQRAAARRAAEVERCAHTAPRFSGDARVAVVRVRSAAQVHPVVATRWAGHLRGAKLEAVLVANDGYLSGRVGFSCRVPKGARARDPPVNLIETLRAIAEGGGEGLLERLGESFARGHKEASGGIVSKEYFEELMGVMGVGEKPVGKKDGEDKKSADERAQKNTLMNYFAKSGQDLKEGVI